MSQEPKILAILSALVRRVDKQVARHDKHEIAIKGLKERLDKLEGKLMREEA